MLSPEGLDENLAEVRRRVAAAARRVGRRPGDVTIVAVSKTMGLARMRGAFDLGQREFGENRVQEAEAKIEAWAASWPDRLDRPAWHLVGHLQTNKARDAVRLFDLIHSVDSVRLAQVLDRWAEAAGRIVPILLEVNVATDPAKYGFRPEDLTAAVCAILPLRGLDVAGLMTVGPLVADPEGSRPVFARLRELRDDLAVAFTQASWRHLSMGMTADYEVAVEEGATLVRVGRAIFGERLA